MDALKRANHIRTERARLKKDLKAGKANIHALLLDPPDYVMTAKVFDMLLAVPKYGRVKANRILNQCRISPSKTIGGLSERQRAELVGQLRRWGPQGRAGQISCRSPPPPTPPPPMAKVFVITGPSGVGKGTLISVLLERVPRPGASISATTGPGRGRWTAATITSSRG